MQNNRQNSIDRTAIWLVLITVCCGFLVLGLDFFFSVSSVLFELTFLSGFGLMVLQIGIVSALAAGVGVATGELVLRHEGCTQSMIRFLRLGRWLPFFVVWAAPIWWIRWSQTLNVPASTEPVAVSSQELAEGLLLTGIAGIIVVKLLQFAADSTFRSSSFFAATHTVPVVLAILSIAWIGVSHWFRATIIAAISFLPFVQSLSGLRNQPVVLRILLALDNALPYAFVGMLFAQLFASTAGLGFLIVVMRAEGNRTEALATSLITFGLLVVVSLALRLVAKTIASSTPPTISHDDPLSRGVEAG